MEEERATRLRVTRTTTRGTHKHCGSVTSTRCYRRGEPASRSSTFQPPAAAAPESTLHRTNAPRKIVPPEPASVNFRQLLSQPASFALHTTRRGAARSRDPDVSRHRPRRWHRDRRARVAAASRASRRRAQRLTSPRPMFRSQSDFRLPGVGVKCLRVRDAAPGARRPRAVAAAAASGASGGPRTHALVPAPAPVPGREEETPVHPRAGLTRSSYLVHRRGPLHRVLHETRSRSAAVAGNVVVGAFFVLSGYVVAYTCTELGKYEASRRVSPAPAFVASRVMGYYPVHRRAGAGRGCSRADNLYNGPSPRRGTRSSPAR